MRVCETVESGTRGFHADLTKYNSLWLEVCFLCPRNAVGVVELEQSVLEVAVVMVEGWPRAHHTQPWQGLWVFFYFHREATERLG